MSLSSSRKSQAKQKRWSSTAEQLDNISTRIIVDTFYSYVFIHALIHCGYARISFKGDEGSVGWMRKKSEYRLSRSWVLRSGILESRASVREFISTEVISPLLTVHVAVEPYR